MYTDNARLKNKSSLKLWTPKLIQSNSNVTIHNLQREESAQEIADTMDSWKTNAKQETRELSRTRKRAVKQRAEQKKKTKEKAT